MDIICIYFDTYNIMKRRNYRKYPISSYISRLKHWTRMSPGTHERTLMYRRCGKTCFLGTQKSFPICRKNTCSVSPAGVQTAYIRAREMTRRAKDGTIHSHNKSYYSRIANRAKRILYK